MFGKKFSEYIRFEQWILILIAAVFVFRLGLSLAGTSIGVTRWVSINLVLVIGLFYCSIAVHTRGFGSYKQLFPLLLAQTLMAHILISLGIILGIVTGIDNIYTVPEYSGGSDGKTWFHAALHIVPG